MMSRLDVPLVLHAPEVPRICIEGWASPRLLEINEEIGVDHLGLLFFDFDSHGQGTLSLFR
jgi:hypothetical protein